MIAALILWAARKLTNRRGAEPTAVQRIYCANHSSHLDFVLLAASLPVVPRPVAAADYWNADPVRRFLVRRVFRAVLIDRRTRCLNPVAPVNNALRQGDSLIFFPEGTRGDGRSLQPLKPGIWHIARMHPEVELVPVWIDAARRTVSFGEPLHWNGEEDGPFLERLCKAMEAARG